MDPVIIVFLILGVAVIAFVSGRVPIAAVAIGVAVALFLTGVLDLQQAMAGFGDPVVIFIATLFVVSEAMESSGVIAWAGNQVVTRVGTKRTPLIIVMCLLTAAITALISVNGAVAALLPLVVMIAARAGIPSSQMLMPLAFSAHTGSMLALTGTPVNIIVSDAASEAGARPFGFFEFAIVGIPLLLGGILIIVFLGPRLLPERNAPTAPVDVQRLADRLRRDYALGPDELAMTAGRGVTEVVIPPRSTLIGMHVFRGMTTPSGDLVILAARRGDETLEGTDSTLRAGDILLLDGTWEDLSRHTADDREVLVVDSPERLRRGIPLGSGARRTIVISGLMIVLLVTGWLPSSIVGLLAAGALILLKVVSMTQAYRAVAWTTVFLVAGMIPMSTAFQTTGAAALIAGGLSSLVGGIGPVAALAAIVLLTLILGQLISNTATVLIITPVAIALSQAMGTSPLPFLMALAVAGAAAYMTPVATPANLMVMEPGQYRFGDYARFGTPFLILTFVLAVFFVPLIWPF